MYITRFTNNIYFYILYNIIYEYTRSSRYIILQYCDTYMIDENLNPLEYPIKALTHEKKTYF